MRDNFINEKALEKAIGRYSTRTVNGFDREIIAETFQMLGHNRLAAVIHHYLHI